MSDPPWLDDRRKGMVWLVVALAALAGVMIALAASIWRGGPSHAAPPLALPAQPALRRAEPAAVCYGGSLSIAMSDGTAIDFCPRGGADYEVAGDHHLSFVFRDLDGRKLVIALAPDQTIAGVALGAMSCSFPMCGGVTMAALGDAADPAVARTFTFSATRLVSSRPGALTATLTGAVTMPGQR